MMSVETGSIEALRLLPPSGVLYDEDSSMGSRAVHEFWSIRQPNRTGVFPVR